MANVAQQKISIFIGECGPIAVREQGLASFGDLIRYTRKKHKVHHDDVAILYGKIAGGYPVTGRHILRMEHNNSFFPRDPNRRRVLATLLRMPPELMAYLSLETITPVVLVQEPVRRPLLSRSSRPIDTQEYYSTLQSYWTEGYPNGMEHAIQDIEGRMDLLKDKVLFEFSPEKPLLTRLLCGYKILHAEIAENQECYAQAAQYLSDAFTLAGERECYDLQAIALLRREMFFIYNGDAGAALSEFTISKQLYHPIAPQVWGYMITLASKSEARLAQDASDILSALKHLNHAEKFVKPISTEDFLFFATFDKQRYLLDCAGTCMKSPSKKWRSPKQASEYLTEAVRQGNVEGTSINSYRQAYHDMVLAKIYCDQGHYLVAATSAENALLTLNKIQSKANLNEIAALFPAIKEHHPLAIEVMSLEAELMKAQRPDLFG